MEQQTGGENIEENQKEASLIEASNLNQTNPNPENPGKTLPKVEIIYSNNPKPYLGGFKSLKTGLIYHHAFAQTDQIPREHKTKFHRDVIFSPINNEIYFFI